MSKFYISRVATLSLLSIAISNVMLQNSVYAQTTPIVKHTKTPTTTTAQLTKMPEVTLDPIITTATRTPTQANNTIAQTRVINEEELQNFVGRTVLDVINSQPEFSITQSGDMGTSSNFYVRGYDSKSVLVLIDGVPYYSISTGTPAINLLPVEQVERIEILYGASGSSLYGANAFGGVIQIFSKGANDTQSQANKSTVLKAGFGTHNHYTVGVQSQFANEKSQLSIGVSQQETSGFNAIANENSSLYHPDADGFKSTNASFALRHQFSPELQAGLSALFSKSQTDFDSGKDIHAYAKQKNGSANGFITYNTANSINTFSFGQSIDHSTSHDSYAIDYNKGSQFNTTQKQAKFQSTINTIFGRKNLGKMIVGAEWLSQGLNASPIANYTDPSKPIAYNPDNRVIKSGLLGYQFHHDKYNVQANYRLDNNSDYGSKSTYYLGVAGKLNQEVQVGASYATGFRMPTFNDLYYPNFGNPNLKPEHSQNTELFAQWADDIQRTRLTSYHSQAKDLINLGKNIDKVKINGISLTSDWQWNNWLFGAGYNHLKAINTNTDKDLPYRPRDTALLYLGYQQPKFNLKFEIKQVGKRLNGDATPIELPSYRLLNIYGSYIFTPKIQGQLRLNNLTDEKYVLSSQYGTEYATDGRNVFASLSYEF